MKKEKNKKTSITLQLSYLVFGQGNRFDLFFFFLSEIQSNLRSTEEMFDNSAHRSIRTDFRCAICRRKNTFHCEHDTPIRDQFLGANEQLSNNDVYRSSLRQTNQQAETSTSINQTFNQLNTNQNSRSCVIL